MESNANEEVCILEETDNFSWEIDESGTEENLQEQEIVYERKAASNEFDIPQYDTGFTGYLTEKEYSMETGEHIHNDCVPKKTCFNCLGDHNISNCPEKKDFQAIARNKKSILGKKSSNVRYHEESENKFFDLKPGKISENLRNALKLHENEAPEFIYRMRTLGYPPGWLKEAEVRRAEVSLIDGSGKRMSHPDEEEGETDISLIKYDPEKLIEFPGFNVPFPNSIRDDYRYLNYPPLQDHHSKENFYKFMNMNRVTKYKKKKLTSQEAPVVENRNVGDMEVEVLNTEDAEIEFNPPLPDEEEIKPPEPPPTSPPPPPPPPEVKEEGELSEDSSDSDQKVFSHTSDKEESIEESIKTDSDASQQDTISDSVKSKVKRHHRSSSKGFTLGVCIPKSENLYNDLPEPSKWSVDVSDHILFENLPDALGTWQKMKGIVKGVQTALEKLKDE